MEAEAHQHCKKTSYYLLMNAILSRSFYSLGFAYLCGLAAYLAILFFCGQMELFSGGIFTPHDSFYPVTEIFQKSLRIFSSRNGLEGGVIHLFVHIPDLVLIAFLKLNFSNLVAQNIHTIVCYILFYSVSYFSFVKIFKGGIISAGLCLIYCLSPFASILYSAGLIYTISTVMALGVIPLFIYAVVEIHFGKSPKFLPEILAILALGVVYLIPALLTLGFVYLSNIKRRDYVSWIGCIWRHHFSHRLLFNALVIPTFLLLVWIGATTVSSAIYPKGAANDAISGGIFYPLFQISTWAIYNPWSPRAVINYSEYFFSIPYKILSLFLVSYIFLSLYKNKKYFYILLILFFAFFAKGPSTPFGQIYNFVLEYLPFGQAIRTPDSKFGAFIITCLLVSIYFVKPKDAKRIILIAGVFTLSNVIGMYRHGAISPSLGDINTSYYVYESDELQVAEAINSQKNHIVLTNQDLCEAILYGGKFHTCADIVLAMVDKQIIGNGGIPNKFSDLLERYKKFPMLIYINKSRVGYRSDELNALLRHDFKLLYSSENYAVLRSLDVKDGCALEYSFSCVKDNLSYYVSAPQAYVDWHFPNATTESTPNGIRLAVDPGDESAKSEYLRLLLLLTYFAALILSITGLVRETRKPITLD